jgi:prolipoprotein diacylglyceryltransferase
LNWQHNAIHSAFDVLAWAASFGLAWALSRSGRIVFPVDRKQRFSYYAAFLFGAGYGGYLFGTLNLIACGMPGFARSIEGAILGAVIAVESYKYFARIPFRTGARFAAPLAIGIVIGRFGCFFSGIDDFTYGLPTCLPWGHDFGDGIIRHPVPLYESAAMATFLIVYLVAAWRNNRFVIDNGLYLVLLWYAAQRFVWEFFKPYAPVLGPLTVFHLLSVALAIYAGAMLLTATPRLHERAVRA